MKANRKNPALIELVLVILFLALSAAVLAQVFARARLLSADSRAQTTGLIAAQDIIERWKADPGSAAALFPADDGWNSDFETEVFISTRDEDMGPAAEGAPAYSLAVRLSEEPQPVGTLYSISVTVSSQREENSEPLVACETAVYVPGDKADAAADREAQP